MRKPFAKQEIKREVRSKVCFFFEVPQVLLVVYRGWNVYCSQITSQAKRHEVFWRRFKPIIIQKKRKIPWIPNNQKQLFLNCVSTTTKIGSNNATVEKETIWKGSKHASSVKGQSGGVLLWIIERNISRLWVSAPNSILYFLHANLVYLGGCLGAVNLYGVFVHCGSCDIASLCLFCLCLHLRHAIWRFALDKLRFNSEI